MWHFPMWWDAFLLVCIAKERIYFESTKFQCVFLIITHQNPLFWLPKASFFAFRTGFHSPFTQMQTFSTSNICLLKSTSSPLSIVHACRLTLSTQFDHTITNLNTMKEKKPVKNGDKKKNLANCFARSFVTPTGFKPVTF